MQSGRIRRDNRAKFRRSTAEPEPRTSADLGARQIAGVKSPWRQEFRHQAP